MNYSKETFLNSFEKVPLNKDKIEPDAYDLKDLILNEDSQYPATTVEKQTLSKAYLRFKWESHRRFSENLEIFSYNNNNNINDNNNNEEEIKIKIDNIFLFNEKFNFPNVIDCFYIKHPKYNDVKGPFSSLSIEEMYRYKKISGFIYIRPIDIFKYKNEELFTFLPLKIINDDNWTDLIIESNILLENNIFYKNLIKEKENAINKQNEKLKLGAKYQKKMKKKKKNEDIGNDIVGISNNKNEVKINSANSLYKKQESK